MGLTWFLRMAKWVRNPPSPRQVKIVLGVIAIAAVIVGLEWAGLWPDWAQMDRAPRLPH